MCKRLLTYTAIFMALFFCVQNTSAKDDSITLTNQTGRTICTLFVSPIVYDWWYPDVLSGKTLANNASHTFTLEWSPDGTYDVMAQDCYSDAITTVFTVNLSAGNSYILRYNQIVHDNTPAPPPGGQDSQDSTEGVPCPSTGAWPLGCVSGGTSPPSNSGGSGGGVPCPSTGAWPSGCVPGGGGGTTSPPSNSGSGGGGGVPCPSTGVWPLGCVP